MLAINLLSEGPHTDLAWLLYTGLGMFLAVIIVGWLSGSRKQDQTEVSHETQFHVQEEKHPIKKSPAKTSITRKKISK